MIIMRTFKWIANSEYIIKANEITMQMTDATIFCTWWFRANIIPFPIVLSTERPCDAKSIIFIRLPIDILEKNYSISQHTKIVNTDIGRSRGLSLLCSGFFSRQIVSSLCHHFLTTLFYQKIKLQMKIMAFQTIAELVQRPCDTKLKHEYQYQTSRQ